MTIPPHLLLHAGLCEKDAMFGVALTKLKKQAGDQIDSRHLLCLLLILERAKGTDSFWYHFIQYLPKSYGKFNHSSTQTTPKHTVKNSE